MAQEKMTDRIITVVITVLVAGVLGLIGSAFSGGFLIEVLEGVTQEQLSTELSKAAAIPKGAVVAYNLASCPEGWEEADYAKQRFIVGVGNTPEFETRTLLENEGGEEVVKLEVDQIPQHAHRLNDIGTAHDDEGTGGADDEWVVKVGRSINTELSILGEKNTEITDTEPHNNMPPFVALRFCEKT